MLIPSSGHDTSLLMIGVKLAGSLLFVLALFLLGVWVVRLLQRQKILALRKSENEIEIRSTRSLGPRAQIAVVSVGHNSFLVGIAPSGISLLGRIDESGSRAVSSVAPAQASHGRPTEAVSISSHAAKGGSSSEPTTFDAAVREALNRIGAVSREKMSGDNSSRWTV